MSRVLDFVRPRRIPQGPIEKKLAVESDRRLYRTIGAGQVAGAWFVAWALTVQFVIPPPLIEVPPEPDDDPPILTFREPPRLKPKPKDPVARALPRENRGAKPQSRHPSEKRGNLQVNPIESFREGLRTAGRDIIKDVMKGIDLDKIEKVEGLRRTEPTVLAGRRGAKTEGYNDPYAQGDGSTREIDLMPASPPGRIESDRGSVDRLAATHAHEIAVSSEGRFRSSDEILRVVRAGTPGLRHLYNTHLKANPGLGGKVTVRFAVAPSGHVVDAAIASGTTGAPRFEEQVLARIRAWRFDPIKAVGNDIVTVPFNFSE